MREFDDIPDSRFDMPLDTLLHNKVKMMYAVTASDPADTNRVNHYKEKIGSGYSLEDTFYRMYNEQPWLFMWCESCRDFKGIDKRLTRIALEAREKYPGTRPCQHAQLSAPDSIEDELAGCLFVGTVKDLEEHEDCCAFAMDVCPHCNVTMPKRSFQQHLEVSCRPCPRGCGHRGRHTCIVDWARDLENGRITLAHLQEYSSQLANVQLRRTGDEADDLENRLAFEVNNLGTPANLVRREFVNAMESAFSHLWIASGAFEDDDERLAATLCRLSTMMNCFAPMARASIFHHSNRHSFLSNNYARFNNDDPAFEPQNNDEEYMQRRWGHQ